MQKESKGLHEQHTLYLSPERFASHCIADFVRRQAQLGCAFRPRAVLFQHNVLATVSSFLNSLNGLEAVRTLGATVAAACTTAAAFALGRGALFTAAAAVAAGAHVHAPAPRRFPRKTTLAPTAAAAASATAAASARAHARSAIEVRVVVVVVVVVDEIAARRERWGRQRMPRPRRHVPRHRPEVLQVHRDQHRERRLLFVGPTQAIDASVFLCGGSGGYQTTRRRLLAQ